MLVCILIAGLYIGQALDVVPSNRELTRTVRDHTQAVRELPGRVAESVEQATSVETWCGEVHFVFRTPDGEVVAGDASLHPLHLPEEERDKQYPLDEDGRLTVANARCSPEYSVFLSQVSPFGAWYRVETVPDQDTYVIETGDLGERERRSKRRREICPLRVVFETADGAPASAQVRMAHVGERSVWLDLDPDGSVEFPEARCTTGPQIWMKRPAPRRPQMLRLERRPDDAPEVVVSLGQTATARVVDADGQRLEGAVLEAENVELLESGDYLVTDFGETTRVHASMSAFESQSFDLPLDGELHELQLTPRRIVGVTLLCDQCAGTFFCGKIPCSGAAPQLQCSCPNQHAEFGMQTKEGLWEMDTIYDLLAVVPPDVNALTVEVRGERASVALRVQERPDLRFERFELYRSADPDALPDHHHYVHIQPLIETLVQTGDTFLVEEIMPGAWTLRWIEHRYVSGEGWQQVPQTFELFVEGGEALDLGVFEG